MTDTHPRFGSALDDRLEPSREAEDFDTTIDGRRAAPTIAAPPIITTNRVARSATTRRAEQSRPSARTGAARRRLRSALVIVLILLAGIGALTVVQLTAPYTHGTVMTAGELADRVRARLDEWGLLPR